MVKIYIYIPTYQRPEALSSQLERLFPQIKKFHDNVRLVIRDNDSNGDYFSDLSIKYAHKSIVFDRNFGNIGANANIALAYVYAKPDEFIWILSDNDLIKPDAIEFLLSNIDPSIDFVVSYDVDQIQKITWGWKDGWVKPIKWKQGLISSALFNSNTIRSSIDQAFYFHNSSFPHLAVACASAKNKKDVIFLHIPESNILDQEGSTQEEPGDYFLSILGMPQLLELFPPNSAREFAREWMSRNGWRLYANKRRKPSLFISTKYLLIKSGGFTVRIYFLKAKILYLLSPFMITIKNALKNKLSKERYEKIKEFLSKFGIE